ncbi:MAG TPA: phytoene desaturase family protein [Candidatus Saccharimonadales bacterium]|jgi:phytoene desaturase
MRQKVIIIGAGIGGLATANLLAKAGYEVHVLEKAQTPGGRAGQKVRSGFRFDTGPSWYLMPGVFEHYFGLLGRSVSDCLTLTRLSPAYKVFYENTPALTITGDLATDAATFEQIEPGAGRALRRYVKQSDQIYALSLQYFLYSNFARKRELLAPAIVRRSASLLRHAFRSIDSYVSTFVTDRRLKQILEYPTVFLGTSPYSAPSLYSLMSALDFKEGVYYPEGGLYAIIQSLETLGRELGVTYHYGTKVTRILTHNHVAVGVLTTEHGSISADIVISNADLHFTETQLLEPHEQTYPDTYWKQIESSPSALLMYIGIKGNLPQLEHHNLLFVDDWKQNFDAIFVHKTIPPKASIYICKPSASDRQVAPNGSENIFVLVPLPSGVTINAAEITRLQHHYLQQIKAMTGADLTRNVVVSETYGPNDFSHDFYSRQGSMLGSSHLLKQSAFFRTSNMSKKVKNLYYVGANTTPGVGLPMCLISAELIYKRLAGDSRGGRVTQISQLSGGET